MYTLCGSDLHAALGFEQLVCCLHLFELLLSRALERAGVPVRVPHQRALSERLLQDR